MMNTQLFEHITNNEATALKSLNQIQFRSNLDVLKVGNTLVRCLLSRYLRRQRFEAVAADYQMESLLEMWLQKAESLHASGVSVPLVAAAEQDGLMPLKIYVVLVLYMHHTHRELQNLCACIHADINRTGMDVQLLEALFEVQDVSADSRFYFHKSDIHCFLENHSLFRFRKMEPDIGNDVYLTSEFLHRLDKDAVMDFPESPYYSVYMPKDVLFAPEDIHIKILGYCSACLHSDSESQYRLMLYGTPGNGKKQFAHYLASSLGMDLYEINVSALLQCKPHLWHQIFNEIPHKQTIVLIPNADILAASGAGLDSLCRSIVDSHGILILTTSKYELCDERLSCLMHQIVIFEKPGSIRRKAIISQFMPDLPAEEIEQIASDYLFSPSQIEQACNLYHAAHRKYPDRDQLQLFIDSCQSVMARSFNGLAVETRSEAARLSHFVLPPDQMAAFETILRAAKNHSKVMHEWGFARHLATGKGLCILFDGVPGTGKTFAAEVIANELHRPLQRVDMSNLVSKWVGETGENIVKLFAAARTNQSILLLDEADALLSKRTAQTSKSTDRYANMEINIILQEIERYDGITILTTNLGQSLDEALERRIQYRITFKEPGVSERQKLWCSLIAPEAPVEPNINYFKLARDYELCGGHIKNAILHAAHLAAPENRAISEKDLAVAAQIEFQKLGHLVQNR